MSDISPEHVLNTDDPGADIFRRYRYQATYAGILSLGMLRADSDITEVFAEHHDDILLKKTYGRFTAVQVKTQQLGGNPFKTTDDAIVGALKKFISHEIAFAGCFECFMIVTNHHFFKADNKSCIDFVAKCAREATGADPEHMDSRLSGFINTLLRQFNTGRDKVARATRLHVLKMLQKLRTDDSLPKLDNIHQELREAIVANDGDYLGATYADLDRAAKALAYETCTCSSLPSDGVVRLYLSYTQNPREAIDASVIEGKRLTKARVAAILKEQIVPCASLMAAEPIDPRTLPSDLSVADKKMTVGGLSATTVSAARDWQASAQYLERKWAMKYNEGPAIDRYNHVSVAVQTACAEAHEASRAVTPQGPAMLETLRAVLKRKKQEGTNFFDCEEEHLLGHAVIRTGLCKVWWSDQFDIG